MATMLPGGREFVMARTGGPGVLTRRVADDHGSGASSASWAASALLLVLQLRAGVLR